MLKRCNPSNTRAQNKRGQIFTRVIDSFCCYCYSSVSRAASSAARELGDQGSGAVYGRIIFNLSSPAEKAATETRTVAWMTQGSTIAALSQRSTAEPQRHGELPRCQCAQLYLECVSTQGSRFLVKYFSIVGRTQQHDSEEFHCATGDHLRLRRDLLLLL